MNRESRFRPIVAVVLTSLLAGGGFVACKKAAAPAGGDAPAAAAKMAPAAPAARVPDGGATPEEVFERMKKAGNEKNMSEIVACLAPQARQEMSAAMYLGATMMVAFSQMGAQMGGAMMEGMGAMAGAEPTAEDKKKAEEQMAKANAELAKLAETYNSVMKKYGLPVLPKEGEAEPKELSKEEMDKLFANLDHSAFVADVVKVMESMPGKEEKGETGPVEKIEGNLENLRIEGDRATATVGGEPASFVRVDGRWYLETDPTGMGGPGGTSAGAPI